MPTANRCVRKLVIGGFFVLSCAESSTDASGDGGPEAQSPSNPATAADAGQAGHDTDPGDDGAASDGKPPTTKPTSPSSDAPQEPTDGAPPAGEPGATNPDGATEEPADGATPAAPSGGLTRPGKSPCDLGDAPPERLSETQCYEDISNQIPAAHLVPYTVVASFWADGAAKRRFLKIPEGETIDYAGAGPWDFPDGTIAIKEFWLDRGANARRIMETRFLRFEKDKWKGYTYQWNDAATEATLSDEDTRVYEVQTSAGMTATHEHLFPAAGDCEECHNEHAGGPLGLRTVQLNRTFNYDGKVENQLSAFERVGLFSEPLPSPVSALPSMPPPDLQTAPLAARARSYLDANCASCHRPGGPGKEVDLRYQTSFANTGTCNESPEAGDIGGGNKIVLPGAPEKSVLWQRLKLRDGSDKQMPPVATKLADPVGTTLIRDWIASINDCP